MMEDLSNYALKKTELASRTQTHISVIITEMVFQYCADIVFE